MQQISSNSFNNIRINSPNSAKLTELQNNNASSALERTPEQDSFVSGKDTKKKKVLIVAALLSAAAIVALAVRRGKKPGLPSGGTGNLSPKGLNDATEEILNSKPVREPKNIVPQASAAPKVQDELTEAIIPDIEKAPLPPKQPDVSDVISKSDDITQHTDARIVDETSDFLTEIQKANEKRCEELLSSADSSKKIDAFLEQQEQALPSARVSDEKLKELKTLREELATKERALSEELAAKELALSEELAAKERYLDTLESIEISKLTSKRADELMTDDEFVKKFNDFMDRKITIPKGKYDCNLVETTLDDALRSTILGTVDDVPETIYHGTTKYSHEAIIKNGFSLDAVGATESGKGIYFGLDKAAAEKYCGTGGKVVEAQYTGRKIAKVTPGVVDTLHENTNVRFAAQDVLGLDAFSEEDTALFRELISRRYTKMLSDLGYDAVQSASLGAGCKYINILDPKNIKIIS